MSINLDIKLKRADKVYNEGVSKVKTYLYRRNQHHKIFISGSHQWSPNHFIELGF